MSTLAPTFDPMTYGALQPAAKPGVRLRLSTGADPVTIGLQMVNWLVLMVLMSGFMLAATMSDRSDPAGTSAEIGNSVTR